MDFTDGRYDYFSYGIVEEPALKFKQKKKSCSN